jgi:hypothetical protein
MIFFSKRLILSFLIHMIRTCAGIDKYAFYLDFKGVLSSNPHASVCVLTSYLSEMRHRFSKKTNKDLIRGHQNLLTVPVNAYSST